MNLKQLSILTLLFLGSCALTESGSRVRLASQVGSSCEFVGSVRASMASRGFDQTNSIKNEAGSIGANWVVVTSTRNGEPDTGEAYKCPEVSGSARRVDKVIDINSNHQVLKKDEDIETKLQKLRRLRDEGVITEEDYIDKKSQILNSY